MSPIVVTPEEYFRLKKFTDKSPSRYNNHAMPITKRHLFLRYTIDGGKPRAKRIEIREQFDNGIGIWSWQMSEIAKHRMSKLLKKSKRKEFVIALVDPSHLEPLLKKLLGHLKADPGEIDYHWEGIE